MHVILHMCTSFPALDFGTSHLLAYACAVLRTCGMGRLIQTALPLWAQPGPHVIASAEVDGCWCSSSVYRRSRGVISQTPTPVSSEAPQRRRDLLFRAN